MKLNNFSSLDPKEQARGVKGLTGTSKLDREVWQDFHQHSEEVAAESEFLWVKVTDPQRDQPSIGDQPANKISGVESDIDVWTGDTECSRVATARLAQGFFRRTVLVAYLGRCCISQNPLQELLVASHILPWADHPSHRANPCNGLLLSRLHDGAFDRGLITFDDDYRLVLSKRIKEHLATESVRHNFAVYEGRKLNLPEKFYPDKSFIAYHRESIFNYG